ncbi:MAG: hypothetical protein JOZ02_13465 [Acidobacteria bacterium]|nr:hypothetical protein [Acidobacteriota bacterium]
MNAGIVVLSCIGTLIVILNKPIGEGLYHAGQALGDRDFDVWTYRGPVIFLGIFLTCLSFAVYD